MDDAHDHEQDIAVAYQSGMEDGSRLAQGVDEDAVTKLGIERGEQWAAAVLGRGSFPDRLL